MAHHVLCLDRVWRILSLHDVSLSSYGWSVYSWSFWQFEELTVLLRTRFYDSGASWVLTLALLRKPEVVVRSTLRLVYIAAGHLCQPLLKTMWLWRVQEGRDGAVRPAWRSLPCWWCVCWNRRGALCPLEPHAATTETESSCFSRAGEGWWEAVVDSKECGGKRASTWTGKSCLSVGKRWGDNLLGTGEGGNKIGSFPPPDTT